MRISAATPKPQQGQSNNFSMVTFVELKEWRLVWAARLRFNRGWVDFACFASCWPHAQLMFPKRAPSSFIERHGSGRNQIQSLPGK